MVVRLADVGLVGERGTGVPNATISEVSVELDVSLTLTLEFSRCAPAELPDLLDAACVLQGAHLILTLKSSRWAPGVWHASAASAAVQRSCCSASDIAECAGLGPSCLSATPVATIDHASALEPCGSQVWSATYTMPVTSRPFGVLGCKLWGQRPLTSLSVVSENSCVHARLTCFAAT